MKDPPYRGERPQSNPHEGCYTTRYPLARDQIPTYSSLRLRGGGPRAVDVTDFEMTIHLFETPADIVGLRHFMPDTFGFVVGGGNG
jgi:hypothetical protein